MSDTRIDFLYLNQMDMIQAGVLDMHHCIDVMEEMFDLMGKGDYLMGGPNRNSHGIEIIPPVSSPFPNMPVSGPDRRFMAMPAYLGGRFNMTGCKWYGSNHDNISKGLPRSILTVTLNDTDTGAPLAFMAANQISSMRTGAIPGVGVRYLANPDSKVLSIIGCGVINKSCVLAIKDACPGIKRAQIYDLFTASSERMGAYVKELDEEVEVVICSSVEESVKGADIITVVTSGETWPYIDGDWLKKGVLVLCPSQTEFSKDCLLSIRKIIDNKSMHQLWGELKGLDVDFHAEVGEVSSYMMEYIDEGLMTWDDVTNIGDIICGKEQGRKNHDEQILFCMGGMPVEDVAWGTEIYRSALAKGIGTKLNFWEEPFR